jgi:hypothetical protein
MEAPVFASAPGGSVHVIMRQSSSDGLCRPCADPVRRLWNRHPLKTVSDQVHFMVIYVCSIANRLQIDLYEALQAKEAINKQRA